jgi:hypothetical protein
MICLGLVTSRFSIRRRPEVPSARASNPFCGERTVPMTDHPRLRNCGQAAADAPRDSDDEDDASVACRHGYLRVLSEILCSDNTVVRGTPAPRWEFDLGA